MPIEDFHNRNLKILAVLPVESSLLLVKRLLKFLDSVCHYKCYNQVLQEDESEQHFVMTKSLVTTLTTLLHIASFFCTP